MLIAIIIGTVKNMNKKQKKNLIRILVAAALMIALHFVPVTGLARFVCYMVPYLVVGYDILLKAGKGIKNRQPFDECLLMVIATLGAIALAVYRSGDYTEAVAVMLFYQIGEWFQSYAVGRSRRNITELMDIRPDYANVEEDGEIVQVDPDDVEVGTVIICRPGEKVPIDGIVEEGHSSLDTSALTGESVPRGVRAGDEIISGCINLSGVLRIRTTKEFGESTVSTILDLVENASSRKSRSENFISRFARVYTPAVVLSAIALALLPPIIRMTALGFPAAWGDWLYRALTFLIISCPCALVISIPLSFFAGLGGASREGVLIKGSNFLEQLSQVKCLVCDKTGTLTHGSFEVVGIHHSDREEREVLRLAALAESASSHPIARSIRRAYLQGKEPAENDQLPAADLACVSDLEEISGQGVRACVDGHQVAAGNEKLMRAVGVEPQACHETGTVIHLAVDGVYAGHILIADRIKATAGPAIRELKAAGVRQIVMLTGDEERVAKSVAADLGIPEYRSGLMPQEKVAEVERLLAEKAAKEALAFVGDGINDAPVLSRADVGIAMGALGSDAAIEAADVVLMDDDPLKIAKAVRIARRTMRIVYENIWFAIGVKLICLLLGALGIANMWLAIFADVGVMVIAVLNAVRALFVKRV